jgi:hypothetical protein
MLSKAFWHGVALSALRCLSSACSFTVLAVISLLVIFFWPTRRPSTRAHGSRAVPGGLGLVISVEHLEFGEVWDDSGSGGPCPLPINRSERKPSEHELTTSSKGVMPVIDAETDRSLVPYAVVCNHHC